MHWLLTPPPLGLLECPRVPVPCALCPVKCVSQLPAAQLWALQVVGRVHLELHSYLPQPLGTGPTGDSDAPEMLDTSLQTRCHGPSAPSRPPRLPSQPRPRFPALRPWPQRGQPQALLACGGRDAAPSPTPHFAHWPTRAFALRMCPALLASAHRGGLGGPKGSVGLGREQSQSSMEGAGAPLPAGTQLDVGTSGHRHSLGFPC